jgi:hypothetical protein
MNRDIRFLPYERAHEIEAEQLIVVDCYYHRGLNLTHLYSDRVPKPYRSNTSTETVLKWVQDSSPERPASNALFVTCNHWDIDGMLSVWCVLNPELAKQHGDLLVSAAHLGDFREFDHTSALGLESLKLCCLLNAVEANEFCLPFGDLGDATIEHEVSVAKFESLLPRFAEWLTDLESYEYLWKPEYDLVLTDIALIESGSVHIEEFDTPKISFVQSATPLNYYAIFSHVNGAAVLTELSDPHYLEFEYRYETAVGRLDRAPVQRLDLSHIAELLSTLEVTTDVRWQFDNINEGGTMLRPEFKHRPLSREDRYQSISYRIAHNLVPASSVDAATVLNLIVDEYKKEKEHTPIVYAP